MTIESSFNYPSDLNASYPAATDTIPEGDDHIRGLKTCLKTSLPNVSGAITATHTQLNYTVGVTSAIQTQLDAKAPIASPTLTGVPTAPTAAVGTSTTQIATTAFVQANGGEAPLTTVTAANSASMDIENAFSTYDAYLIVVTGLVPASTQFLSITLKVGGAYQATGYYFHTSLQPSSSDNYLGDGGANGTSILLGSAVNSAGHLNLNIYVYNPASTTLHKTIAFNGVMATATSSVNVNGSGLYGSATTALTGVRLAMASGNITSGVARLYPIKNS